MTTAQQVAIKAAERAAKEAGWHKVRGREHTWESYGRCIAIGYPAIVLSDGPARTQVTPSQAMGYFLGFPLVSAAAAALGRLGGRAGTGSAKKRTTEHYQKAGAAGGRAKARAMREVASGKSAGSGK